MIRGGVMLPWLGAALMAAVVAMEWTGASWPGREPSPRAAPFPDPAHPTEPPEDRADAWAATALARPLFSLDRRPAPQASNAGPRELPRLTAVLIAPEGRTAIFAAGGAAKAMVVREGESIAGFTVVSIAPGSVTVRGPMGVRSLRPLLDVR